MSAGIIPQGAVELALAKQLFGRFTVRERLLSVATTVTQVLKNNPERIGFVITNTGNIQITLSTRQTVVAGKGLIIAQQSDTISTTFVEDGQFPTLELSGIASAAGGEVSILEFIRESKQGIEGA